MKLITKLLSATAAIGACAALATPAYADAGFYLRGDLGRSIDAEASAGGSTLSVNDTNLLQVGAGLDFGRLSIDGTWSRESGDITLGVDGNITNWMGNAELALFSVADGETYVRGGYGISEAEVDLGFTTFSGDGGQTWALGGGWQREVGGLTIDVGYEYRDTSGLDFGFGTDVDYSRHLLRVGIRS